MSQKSTYERRGQDFQIQYSPLYHHLRHDLHHDLHLSTPQETPPTVYSGSLPIIPLLTHYRVHSNLTQSQEKMGWNKWLPLSHIQIPPTLVAPVHRSTTN